MPTKDNTFQIVATAYVDFILSTSTLQLGVLLLIQLWNQQPDEWDSNNLRWAGWDEQT
jgi:hypothetical protein